MSKAQAYRMAATVAYAKRKPLTVALGIGVLGVGGYVGIKALNRSAAFKAAAAGNVNALAAQSIGDMLPAGWKSASWIAKMVLPASVFSAAREVEDWFKSDNFKSKIFALTETVTDARQFDRYFSAMWGFSFYTAMHKNLSPADVAQVTQSLQREKVRTKPELENKGLYMVTSKPLTPADVAVVVNNVIYATNGTIPVGTIVGISDGNSISKGTIREGWTGKLTFKLSTSSNVTISVIADKTKIKLYPADAVAKNKFKLVSPSYVKLGK